MADFISKHLSTILLGTGVVSASVALGYFMGKKKRTDELKSTQMKSYFNKEDPLMAYILDNSLREPTFLSELREETKTKTGVDIRMIVDPLEAQFLRLLLAAYGAKR